MAVTERIEDLSDPTFNPYLADEAVFGTMHDPYPRIAELPLVLAEPEFHVTPHPRVSARAACQGPAPR